MKSVRLTREGVPHLELFEDGTIFNTITKRVMPFKKGAASPSVECRSALLNKTVHLTLHILMRRYFNNELLALPEKDRLNLNFMGLSSYSVTRDGRIWSHLQENWMNPKSPNNSGYITLSLHLDNKKVFHTKLHRLIALAFVPNPNGFVEVDHLDGNKLNNRADNLEWVSTSENLRRAREKGLRPQALTDDEIHLACKLIVQGKSTSEIGKLLGTSTQNIEHLRNGVTHQHISGQYGIEPHVYKRTVPIDYSKYKKRWEQFKTYIPKNNKIEN